MEPSSAGAGLDRRDGRGGQDGAGGPDSADMTLSGIGYATVTKTQQRATGETDSVAQGDCGSAGRHDASDETAGRCAQPCTNWAMDKGVAAAQRR